jgi:hypothetical protein
LGQSQANPHRPDYKFKIACEHNAMALFIFLKHFIVSGEAFRVFLKGGVSFGVLEGPSKAEQSPVKKLKSVGPTAGEFHSNGWVLLGQH